MKLGAKDTDVVIEKTNLEFATTALLRLLNIESRDVTTAVSAANTVATLDLFCACTGKGLMRG